MTTINKTIQISERTFKKCVGRLPQSIDELNFFAEHFVEYEWEDLISGDWAEYFDEVGDEYHLPPEPEEVGSLPPEAGGFRQDEIEMMMNAVRKELLLRAEASGDTITVPLYHYINEEPPLCPEDPAIGDKMYDTDSIAEEIERLFHQHTGIKISVAMRVK